MGNRALITTESKKIGLYLHWNGGRDSIEAFLKYCELQGFRSPEKDSYGWARLCQIIGNYFGGSTSVGIENYFEMLEDNGIYIIENWKIVNRILPYKGFTEQQEYELNEMLKSIDEQQPKHIQLGEYLDAKEINTNELKIGDIVYVDSYDGKEKCTVIGFGKDEFINGTNVKGIPFVNKYNNEDYSCNINNYITTKTVKKCDK